MWTGAHARGVPAHRISHWLSASQAALAGITLSKGSIAVGRDADLVLWDPDAESVVDPAALHHRHPVTPYAGMTLRGRVKTTLLRGEIVFDDDKVVERKHGKMILSR